jgi:hypothetical protein
MEWLKGESLSKSAKTYLSVSLSTINHGMSLDWNWISVLQTLQDSVVNRVDYPGITRFLDFVHRPVF